MTATVAEYALALTEGERNELMNLLERELSDIHVERRRTDAAGYRECLREEEATLRMLAAKVRQLHAPVAQPRQ